MRGRSRLAVSRSRSLVEEEDVFRREERWRSLSLSLSFDLGVSRSRSVVFRRLGSTMLDIVAGGV